MTVKRLSIALVALATVALLIVGLVQLGGSPAATEPSRLTLAQMQAQLAGSPSALASLHAQASQVLPGGLPALRARLAALHGRPLVVNKWASWCGPCRSEFGVFQRVSVSDGRNVAFVGIDSGDASPADARSFLHTFPVSFPSYYDHSGQAGLAVTDSTFTPVTVIYNGHGGKFIRQGPYLTAAKLEGDIRRYGLDG